MFPRSVLEQLIAAKEQKISYLVNEVRRSDTEQTAILEKIHRMESELTPLRDRLAAESLAADFAAKKAG